MLEAAEPSRVAAAQRPAAARARSPGRGAAGLRENVAWTLAGNVVYAGCQWGILVAVARLSSPVALGHLALAYAVTAPTFALGGLHLRVQEATDVSGVRGHRDYALARALGLSAAVAFTLALVLARGDAAAGLAVLAVAASKAIEGLSDGCYAVMQRQERMREVALSLALRGLSALGAVTAALALGATLPSALAALAVAWAVVLLAHDRPAAAALLRRHGGGGGGRPRDVARLVAASLPLGLMVMLVSLRTNVPRYFVEARVGAAGLGVFAALSSLLAAANVVVSAVGQAATPRLAHQFHAGDLRAFRRLVAILLAVAAALGAAGVAGAALVGGPALRLVFGPRLAGHAPLLVALMAVGLLSHLASFLGYALTATRRFHVQLPVFAATTLACAAASAALVPRVGLGGAAAAWGASLLLELVVLGVLVEAALRRRAAGGMP